MFVFVFMFVFVLVFVFKFANLLFVDAMYATEEFCYQRFLVLTLVLLSIEIDETT